MSYSSKYGKLGETKSIVTKRVEYIGSLVRIQALITSLLNSETFDAVEEYKLILIGKGDVPVTNSAWEIDKDE